MWALRQVRLGSICPFSCLPTDWSQLLVPVALRLPVPSLGLAVPLGHGVACAPSRIQTCVRLRASRDCVCAGVGRSPRAPGSRQGGKAVCSGRVQGMRGWGGDASREGQASPGMTGGKKPVSHPGVTHGARGSPSPLMRCQGQVPTAPVAMSMLHPDPEGEPDGCCGTRDGEEPPCCSCSSCPVCPGVEAGPAARSGEQKAGTHHSLPIRRFPQGWAAPLLPAEDPAPSRGWGWSQEVTPWLWGHRRGATG